MSDIDERSLLVDLLDPNQAGRLPFRSVGSDVTVWEHARIIGAELISLGSHVIIDDFVMLMATEAMTVGDYVHIGAGTTVMGGGEFRMGDFAGLSGGVRVYTGNEDYLGGSLTNPTVPEPYRKPIRSFVHIGKHAIVGANSVILPGVEIGAGAAVGALSLVNKDLEPWTIYAGSPARPIKERPRERMLELEAELRRSEV
jgi:acetyltransferase-like isoleucine patch superfamily enzyme